MRTTKTIEVAAAPARTKQIDGPALCDFCGCKVEPTEDVYNDQFDAGMLSFEKRSSKVELKREHGYRFSDCGSVTEETVDCCPSCWESRVKPWLASQGIVPTVTESDW